MLRRDDQILPMSDTPHMHAGLALSGAEALPCVVRAAAVYYYTLAHSRPGSP